MRAEDTAETIEDSVGARRDLEPWVKAQPNLANRLDPSSYGSKIKKRKNFLSRSRFSYPFISWSFCLKYFEPWGKLSSLKSETSDSSTLLSSSGWGAKKADEKNASSASGSKNGDGDNGGSGLRPWASTKRGVPGLNQPEPRGKEAFTDLGTKRRGLSGALTNGAENERNSRATEPKRPSNPAQVKNLVSANFKDLKI